MTRTLAFSAKKFSTRTAAHGNAAATTAPPDEESFVQDPALEADRRLVARCLAGEESAWRDLYDLQHPALLKSLRLLLGARAADDHLVYELAAGVWFALVRRGGRLLRKFDPARQRGLGTYLAGLARIEVLRHLRSEGRRRTHEWHSARRSREEVSADDWQIRAMMNDFITTLTPAERECVEDHLNGGGPQDDPPPARPSVSSCNLWQRRHRIRAKIREYFRKV